MKFGHLFEFLKIPDWYTEYLHYNELKDKISEFKHMCKQGEAKQLKGYYMINNKGQIYCIDFINKYRENMAHNTFVSPALTKWEKKH